jgi:hypothetical protein
MVALLKEIRVNKASGTEESAFAEYTALRQEISDRISMRQTILTLQLTIAGGLYSFALAQSSHLKYLLLVPFTTCMLFFRLVEQYYGTREAALYIQNKLSPRVRGGFGWDAWRLENTIRPGGPGRKLARAALGGSPYIISFPAVSAAALIWAIPFTFISGQHRPPIESVGLAAVWICGALVTLVTVGVGVQVQRVLESGVGNSTASESVSSKASDAR